MKQSATSRTVRRTAHPAEYRLKSTRLRLHLPRHLARDELRALGWMGSVDLEQLLDDGKAAPPDGRRPN